MQGSTEVQKLASDQQGQDSQENLLGVFAVLLEVAKRTDPERYVVGYKKNND